MLRDTYKGRKLLAIRMNKGREWGTVGVWVNGVLVWRVRGSSEEKELASARAYCDEADRRPDAYGDAWKVKTRQR